MASLKSKRKKQAEIENLTEELENAPVEEATAEEIPVEETPDKENQYLNEAEQNALAEQHEKDSAESKKVSIAKMERAVEVASDHFNLYGKDFIVNGFADKGAKCQLSMSNGDFDIVVTIKDAEKYGIA